MAQRKAHLIWIEQCEAVQSIKTRFGLKAAFDYIVREKLLNFAEASSHDPDFARELPRFVSEIRRMFAPHDCNSGSARLPPKKGRAAEGARPPRGDIGGRWIPQRMYCLTRK